MTNTPTGRLGLDGLDILVGFHGDLRRETKDFLGVLREGPPAGKVRQAAERYAGFLKGPLFDHEEAETALLMPLLARVKGREVVKLQQASENGHASLGKQRLKLIDTLDEFLTGKRTTDELREVLAAFSAMANEHLQAEESHLYPAARKALNEIDRRDLAAQIRELDHVNASRGTAQPRA